jgi:hypothetical protein
LHPAGIRSAFLAPNHRESDNVLAKSLHLQSLCTAQ